MRFFLIVGSNIDGSFGFDSGSWSMSSKQSGDTQEGGLESLVSPSPGQGFEIVMLTSHPKEILEASS